MPPKFDPSQVVDVFVRVTGGEVGAASSLAPKIGPLGLSLKKMGYVLMLGIELLSLPTWPVMVVNFLIYSTCSMSQKETGRRSKTYSTAATSRSIDDVIEISLVMHPRSMAKDLAGAVKEILGTCVSVGCTLDGKDPKDPQSEISDGEVEIPSA
ncbi:60S ribosomal protein L12 [Rhynchospora pubera]|uniref:60S ribosomal protein L12 n=1 Tax=Rhynchospora pubera TaxID=906938 RepID=A0AAV8G1K2_9POAL|nr:60S ribosomal protein L12 [Rhynchospora pubera]